MERSKGMKISVRTALMADKIKDLLDGNTIDGVTFNYLEKQGIELIFNVTGDNIETLDVAAITKSSIKATSYGKGLYFSVTEKQ
jgi:hypothetical protein